MYAIRSYYGDARLQRLNGVASWEKSGDVQRPIGQARQLHGHAADNQHGQEDGLAERLAERRPAVGVAEAVELQSYNFV